MPTFHNDKAALLWGATAVPNGFFCEYMPAAPEGHVKVYLYGLMRACAGADDDAPLDDVAAALFMDRGEVERALRYWERCRLVERVKDHPPEYRFLSVHEALTQKRQIPSDEGYEAFAQAIYAAFGDRRKLHGGETVLAYEWVEQLKLPPEIVMMLIQHMIATRGVQFGFKEAQKLATEMSEQQIMTIDAAEAFFSRSEAAWKGARKVLARMSKRRSPTLDEIDLYVKWTGDWGFAPKAVEAACAETTKGDPSFSYLDGILNGLRKRSGGAARTAPEVETRIRTEREETDNVREMLAAMRQSASTVDEGVRAVYRDMRARVEHGVIVLAARTVADRRGRGTLDDVAALVDAWSQKGMRSAEAVQEHLNGVAALNARLRELFALAGRGAGCTQPNRELLQKWRDDWRMPDALLDAAAEMSKNVDRPMPYMDKLLSGWRDEGVATVEAAREAHARHAEGAQRAAAGGKTRLMNEQKYEQREYDPAVYDGLSQQQIEEMSKH